MYLTLTELIDQLVQARSMESNAGGNLVAVENVITDWLYIESVQIVNGRAHIITTEVDRT